MIHSWGLKITLEWQQGTKHNGEIPCNKKKSHQQQLLQHRHHLSVYAAVHVVLRDEIEFVSDDSMNNVFYGLKMYESHIKENRLWKVISAGLQ